MTTPTVAQFRTNWFALFAGLAAAPILYVFIARQVAPDASPGPELPLLRTAFMALAGVQLVIGALVLLRARAPAFFGAADATTAIGELAPPAQFQLRSIIGMAMFEAVSIYGFVLVFLGGDPKDCVAWSATSLIGMLGVALPAGAGYWRDLAEQESNSTAPPGRAT